MPRSINEILQDRTIRHAHFLARLSSAEANKITRFLEREVYPDLVEQIRKRLERARLSGARNLRSTKRLQEIEKEIDALIRAGHQSAYSRTSQTLRDMALMESRFTTRLLEEVLEPFGISVSAPSNSMLRAIVTNSAIRGEFLRDDFAAMTGRTRRSVVSAINIGLVEGEGVDNIVRRLTGTRRAPGGVLKASRVDARRIVRTAATHTTTQAREITYQENDDLIKGVRWVATLDDRTSLVCISLDGTIYPVDDGPRPPAHPNCRSTTVPVLKSYSELGLNIPDIPQTTRASMNGQVPANTTYAQWLKSQPVSVQNEVLGNRLATEWRAGRVGVDRFIDQNNRPLSISQILRLEGLD